MNAIWQDADIMMGTLFGMNYKCWNSYAIEKRSRQSLMRMQWLRCTTECCQIQKKVAVKLKSSFWGYIPAKDNDVIAQFLDMCSEKCFSCTISRINSSEHYKNQIRLTIRINGNEQ